MDTGPTTLAPLSVGTSGWSYPSWKRRRQGRRGPAEDRSPAAAGGRRPGFYPAGTGPSEFLAFYAQRFPTVELNTTGYRLPSEEQFRRWAAQAPDGFEFAPKLPARARGLDVFESRVRALGDRLGPVRVALKSPRDDGMLELLLGSLSEDLRLAFDLEHPSWDGVEERLAAAGAVRVNDVGHPAPFRYLRRREPPDAAFVETVRALREPAYVFFRHDEEPTAPAYALQLLEALSAR